MRCQCSYYTPKGTRCTAEAIRRVHFFPFSHLNLCEEHFAEYEQYVWVEALFDKNGKELVQ